MSHPRTTDTVHTLLRLRICNAELCCSQFLCYNTSLFIVDRYSWFSFSPIFLLIPVADTRQSWQETGLLVSSTILRSIYFTEFHFKRLMSHLLNSLLWIVYSFDQDDVIFLAIFDVFFDDFFDIIFALLLFACKSWVFWSGWPSMLLQMPRRTRPRPRSTSDPAWWSPAQMSTLFVEFISFITSISFVDDNQSFRFVECHFLMFCRSRPSVAGFWMTSPQWLMRWMLNSRRRRNQRLCSFWSH